MSEIHLTKEEARRFILLKQGLYGEYTYSGKEGILEFIHNAGCIQFDPIDVCGKSPEIVLHSRVKGFSKSLLSELLYKDRFLIDYFDKNLSIIPVENWPCYEREREKHRTWERSHEEIKKVHDRIIDEISARGPLCSSDLAISEKVDWYWNETKLSRAALEHLYFCGELAIHHKKGTIKYYDLIENCIHKSILNSPDPNPDDFNYRKWCVFQRIGSVGMLWNKASDAWLGIAGLKAEERNKIFSCLIAEERITPIRIENISYVLYCRTEDLLLINKIKNNSLKKKRCEFIAPLDNMMWDRKLIKAIFGFDYKWEIYTPCSERKYGFYVLPVLYGDCFIGRIEMVVDKKEKTLIVKSIWYEEGVRKTKKLIAEIEQCIKRFSKFNECKNIRIEI